MLARIIVIDDEPHVRQSLVLILERAQYFVVSAGNGKEGIALIGPGLFDLAILDSLLPDMDSPTLIDRIHAIAPLTKIIILSADARLETIQHALQKGALAYLLKPTEPDVFLGVISDLLQGKPVKKTGSVFPNV